MIANQDPNENQLQLQILTLLEELRKIDTEIEKLEEEKKSLQDRMCRIVPPIFREKLRGWVPKVGESAVIINCLQQACYEIIVTKVDGATVRAREGDKNCFHTFEILMPAENYEQPVFVVSVALYQELKPILDFRFLPTYIERGKDYRSDIPSWA